MLVDNKFIYISLPRCASTSFMVSCIKNNITINHVWKKTDNQQFIVDKELPSDLMANILEHGHESLIDLTNMFGNHYDIISVRRNRYERFISTWEHIIDELEKKYEYDVANIFKSFNEYDILQYTSNDIVKYDSLVEYVDKFLYKHNIRVSNQKNAQYLRNILSILIFPISLLHNNNPNIIWFDFNKLYELEEWVANKIKKPFKLEKINSSKHIECNFKLTNSFITMYDDIYDVYDFNKAEKSII